MTPLRKILVAAILYLSTPAMATTVQQSGTPTPGHLPYWVTNGVIGDGGTSADSPITSLGVTGQICSNSDRIASGSWNSVCIQAFTNAPGVVSIQNSGAATAQGLNFVINGTIVSIPTGGGTFVFGNGPFAVGDVPCFATIAGVIKDCGLSLANGIISAGSWQATPVGVAFGGTGGTTAATARTGLGLGTISTQNANAVAITGGTATGLPTPVSPADVAIKSYVDSVAVGLIILPQTLLATATVLPNSPTYNNGASGVGATLTAGSNSTLTVDGVVAALNSVVLVKNQAAPAQNGIYTVTTAGSGAAAWVLTRATYFNQNTNMLNGSYTFITSGTVNANSSWVLSGTVATVGTTAANFNQFSASSGGNTAGVPTTPQGRLTLTSGTPVMATSVSGAITVYYTSYAGFNVPIYNGSTVQNYALCAANTAGACELNVSLGSNWVTNSNYDWFIALNGSSATLCSGPAWTSDTARGTGAGTTQLQQLSGFNTNAVSITCNTSNSTSLSVPANQATYVGTMRTGLTGQTNYIYGASATGGTAGVFGLWNAYNRIAIKTTVNDSNPSGWSYSSTTPRPADGSLTNRVSFISGLSEDGLSCNYMVGLNLPASAPGAFFQAGCSLDSITVLDRVQVPFNGTSSAMHMPINAKNDYNPVLGWHYVQAMEGGDGTNTVSSNTITQEAFIFEFEN